jgi:hypothetical protein
MPWYRIASSGDGEEVAIHGEGRGGEERRGVVARRRGQRLAIDLHWIVLCAVCVNISEERREEKRRDTRIQEGSGHGGVVNKRSHVSDLTRGEERD